jgi:hypothetical protein
MSSPIQRNTTLSPVPVQTPLIAQAPGTKNPPQTLSFGWVKWHQNACTAINAAPQIQSSVPASSTDSGTAGDIAFDSTYLYVAVGENQWMRVALSTF